ncbi:MAG: transposase [Gracilibacteraceae bacterium]|jgi:transposase|nr:transposase [Gracilibacteraceae bacterium]
MDKKPSFKPYNQGQITFLPPSLEELIPEDHIVRIVDSAIENIDTKPLYEKYEGGGASSYNPVMMLKIIIYAYTQKIFSCRGIAKNCRENIMFMWLSGMNMPDYKTIDRFRVQRMKDIIPDIFTEVIAMLHSKGYIKLEKYFLESTRIKPDAGKDSWSWVKNPKKFNEKLREKCEELLESIGEIERQENQEFGEEDLPELKAGKDIGSQSILDTADKINKKLSRKPEDSTNRWEGLKKLWRGFSGVK